MAERIPRWFANFAERNDGLTDIQLTEGGLTAQGGNGAWVICTVPFRWWWKPSGDPVEALAAHLQTERTVGVLLVRLGGFGVGIFRGTVPEVTKVGSRHVQGRSAAGGWSQQRFARRRANQAEAALGAAVETAARILVPRAAELDALVFGGEKRAVDRVMSDGRLAPLGRLPFEPRFLTVPGPRNDVLLETPAMFRAVSIAVTDP